MKKIGKSTKLYLIGIVVGAVVFGITTVVADTIINSTNVSYKTTTVKAALDDLYGLTADDIWKKIYPVGAIYISVSSTSPATLFGGTWVAFGQSRTLVGVGSSSANINTMSDFGEAFVGVTLGATSEVRGGEYFHALIEDEMPTHTHTGGTLNFNSRLYFPRNSYDNGSLPWGQTDSGSCWIKTDPGSTSGGSLKINVTSYAGSTSLKAGYFTWDCNTSGKWNGETSSVGGGTYHNNVQPYVTVYMWKRTA